MTRRKKYPASDRLQDQLEDLRRERDPGGLLEKQLKMVEDIAGRSADATAAASIAIDAMVRVMRLRYGKDVASGQKARFRGEVNREKQAASAAREHTLWVGEWRKLRVQRQGKITKIEAAQIIAKECNPRRSYRTVYRVLCKTR